MKIRTASLSDIETLEALVNKAYRGEVAKKGWTSESDFLGGIRTDRDHLNSLIASEGQIELLESDGFLLGCVFLKKEPSSCYVGMLAVDPEIQGKGLGKILLKHAENIARQWKCPFMRMSVIHLRCELLDYYKRYGYKETGKVEPFPADPRFGTPKVKDIVFLELVKVISD